jgi:hypothetical protein
MMKMLTSRWSRAYLGLAACAVFCAAAGPILADDFMPPAFRGDELTVYSEWDFELDFPYNLDQNNIPPDDLTSVGKEGYEIYDTYTHAHVLGMTWVDGIWYVDPGEEFGQIYFWIENWVDDMHYKHLWIQLTYGGEGEPPIPPQIAEIEGRQWVGPNPEDHVYYDGYINDFIQHTANQRVEHWMLEPNPDVESILILVPPGTWLDQVVIDTISTNDVTRTESETWSGVKNLFR